MTTLLLDDALLAEHGPGDTGRVVVWENGAPVQKDWRWGFKPFEPGGPPVTLLRLDGRTIINPCLIVVNDFGLKVDGRMRYRATLVTDQPFFCLAGVWRPAEDGWPTSFAALTTEASPDIAPFKDRHVAVIRDDEWYDWLQMSKPVSELRRPFPLGSFRVTGKGGKQVFPDQEGRNMSPRSAASGDLFDPGRGW